MAERIRLSDVASVTIEAMPAGVALHTAERFVEIGGLAIEERGIFSVALAGGSTPRSAYELLSSPQMKGRLDWTRTFVFFGDERCVPPDNSESNFRMANETLLSAVPVPENQVFRMRGEVEPAVSAREYEEQMMRFFFDAPWPRLDLILLGMGDDGHTASLFPGSKALDEETRWVTENWVQKFGTNRITLTFPAINHSRHILFGVTGASKAGILHSVLYPDQSAGKLPAARVCPVDGMVEWYVDEQAAQAVG